MQIAMSPEEARAVYARLNPGPGGHINLQAGLQQIARERGNTLAIEFELMRIRHPHMVIEEGDE